MMVTPTVTRRNPLVDNLTSKEWAALNTRWRCRIDFWENLARRRGADGTH